MKKNRLDKRATVLLTVFIMLLLWPANTAVSQGTATMAITVTLAVGCAEDNIPPVAICQNITVQLDNKGNVCITADQIDAGSYDNCGIARIVVKPKCFKSKDIGDNIVTLTVTDTSHNVTDCTAVVTVRKRGDLNGDDKVNIIDVMMCVNIILKIEPYTKAADLNGDGVVNIIDLQIMIGIILGL